MYYFLGPTRIVHNSLGFLITATYTLEHLIIYCECLFWQAKSLFSLCLFFLGVTMAHNVLTLNKLMSMLLAWLYGVSLDLSYLAVVRRSSGALFLVLFLALYLINQIVFWLTARLIHASRADLQRLFRDIPIIDRRPWGAHLAYLHNFRLWLYHFQYLTEYWTVWTHQPAHCSSRSLSNKWGMRNYWFLRINFTVLLSAPITLVLYIANLKVFATAVV